MTSRMILLAGLSALVLGGPLVSTALGGIAEASDRSSARADKEASANAGKALKALARRDGAAAIGFAEAAVALAPRSGDYRQVLGQSYLQAGRFASARTAFADALSLSPDNGKAALNLALAAVAGGDWAAARDTLAAHAAIIPASDRGLALALAGDPAGAVQLLTQAARSGDTSVKVRQNLALALALSGDWAMARVVAAADMSPADVDQRMVEWAAFAQPRAASDQVAALLGVRAVADAGQPVALALNAPASMALPVAVAAIPAAPEPVAAAAVLPAAETVAPASTIQPMLAKVVFGPRAEVVQALPVPTIAARPGLVKVAADGEMVKFLPGREPAEAGPHAGTPAKAPVALAAGNWFVQLGAFENAGVARDAWGRAQRRFAGFAGHAPNGAAFNGRGGSFYRLSVGGFTRTDADATCRRYRSAGGQCFVRAGAGDRVAQWTRPGVQLASR